MQRPSAGLSPRVGSPFSPSAPRPLPGLTVRLGPASVEGGRGRRGVCVRVGSAAAARGPLQAALPEGKEFPSPPQARPQDVPPPRNPPYPRAQAGRGRYSGGPGCSGTGEKPTADPFGAPRPPCLRGRLTFRRTGSRANPLLQSDFSALRSPSFAFESGGIFFFFRGPSGP